MQPCHLGSLVQRPQVVALNRCTAESSCCEPPPASHHVLCHPSVHAPVECTDGKCKGWLPCRQAMVLSLSRDSTEQKALRCVLPSHALVCIVKRLGLAGIVKHLYEIDLEPQHRLAFENELTAFTLITQQPVTQLH